MLTKIHLVLTQLWQRQPKKKASTTARSKKQWRHHRPVASPSSSSQEGKRWKEEKERRNRLSSGPYEGSSVILSAAYKSEEKKEIWKLLGNLWNKYNCQEWVTSQQWSHHAWSHHASLVAGFLPLYFINSLVVLDICAPTCGPIFVLAHLIKWRASESF